MIRRLLLFSLLGACSLPAQFGLFLVQNGQDVASSDQTYGFGTKPVGAVVNLEFHLRNSGADAILTDLHLSSTDFQFIPSAPSLPQAVAAGTALDLMVQFRPGKAGAATADLIANGVKLGTFNGIGLASVTVSMGDGSPVPSPLEFGSVKRGESSARTIRISNGENSAVLVNVGTRDKTFQVKPGTSPIPIAAGETATIEIDFVPAADGPQQSALLIDQLVFPLVGTGLEPPFPPPTIDLDRADLASAQQGKLTVRLASPSQATGTGEVDMDIQPSDASANLDSGIQFLSTGTRTATFNVNQGDTVAHFGSDISATFQTGTTAGNIVFTVKLGYFTTTKTLRIAPAVVGLDSSKAQRTSAGLDLLLSAFDNTRSATSMTFTFFDQSGTKLPPGAITVDASAALGQFFTSSDLGGAFSLHAFFPVNGNPGQVDSVEVQIVNSAGTAQTARLPFTTP
ncbi:MAG: choice-of-anchor D domain-containing protein [Acidobacteriia bacterium]|nr:choice-of-anchor D domain-containing protein [Terriglobia bacterium]